MTDEQAVRPRFTEDQLRVWLTPGAWASNYNASMWGNLVSNLGGLAGFYLNSQANNTVPKSPGVPA